MGPKFVEWWGLAGVVGVCITGSVTSRRCGILSLLTTARHQLLPWVITDLDSSSERQADIDGNINTVTGRERLHSLTPWMQTLNSILHTISPPSSTSHCRNVNTAMPLYYDVGVLITVWNWAQLMRTLVYCIMFWTILEIWSSAVKQPERLDCDSESSLGVLSSLWLCGMVGQVSSWSVLP